MLTPAAAIASVFRKYADFTGRAPRSEYWWFGLILWVVFVALSLLQLIPTGTDRNGYPSHNFELVFMLVAPIVAIGVLLPSLAVLVRRLHDANFSGWFALLALVPLVGAVVVLVFTLLPSNSVGARFDRQPSVPGLSFQGSGLR
ncbi:MULTISPECIES: DUF805 domain-containing protein [unclassified Cryobacterium]|uniref:DUF805 domain-containing protein n=1 Tax=unclassified Cryobacterium TaxID=2649013 RepID=UPI00106B7E78|nr:MULTISPECIES: DUF805 domain-containing protein [unclassified Cryobacterium]TFC58694.1 DUF805 domain-containing protein [Cryobacterium sp. TMB3-1-2]TFC67115.1 DUF805 domain-containing protein [Cryobacterium sp. TMB3-15]TFC73372.1 DUF805 domain-containing protein [Cryobacterium sp. TMB3-10]TFD44155.1 DUF805 domain-containing protein [Cryobacterium sp. TMB3-12]